MPALTEELTFGQLHFAQADLKDVRRTRRLVASVDRMVRHPGGTLPDKFRSPADLKAFYDLCDRPEVTHAAVLAPHRRRTLDAVTRLEGEMLVLHDATELDYSTLLTLREHLGQIGNGSRRGYLCQNSLAVRADTGDVLGVVQQVLHCRDSVPAKETREQTRQRESRESRLWIQGTADLPGDRRIIDVCDQLADTFEFLEHESQSGRRFVIRSHYDRKIALGHGPPAQDGGRKLKTYARTLGSWGTRTLNLPGSPGRAKRVAVLEISAAAVQLIAPRQKCGDHGDDPLAVWIVRVWEPDTPRGEEPLEWFLLTNEAVETLDDARRVIGWYECRWIVEEYHKALKTGCGIETLQFTCASRLQPAIAALSVVALTLLRLRDLAVRPDAKTRPATDAVSADYVKVLSAWRHGDVRRDWSLHDFFYALARLGGHQNRRWDKRPGWLVLWRGWMHLEAMLDGARAARIIARRGET